jgi:hypothetical protein
MTAEGPGLLRPDELRLVDADALTSSVLLAPGTAGDFYYSPDGSKIALVNYETISVVNADGSGRVDLLTFPIVMTYSEYNFYPPVVWSPDSSYLRVSIPPHEPLKEPPDPTQIWNIPVDGTPPSVMMTITPVPFFQDNVHISPDTGSVAYLTMVTPGAPPVVDLHVSNADGSGDVLYDTGDLRFEAWSTDGVHFIYTEAGSNPKIGRADTAPLSLTGITLMGEVSWVDETRYLYRNRPAGSWELWLRELGSPGILITSTTGDPIQYDFIQ